MTPDEERAGYLDGLEADAERRTEEARARAARGEIDPDIARLARILGIDGETIRRDEQRERARRDVLILALSVLCGGSLTAAILTLLLR